MAFSVAFSSDFFLGIAVVLVLVCTSYVFVYASTWVAVTPKFSMENLLFFVSIYLFEPYFPPQLFSLNRSKYKFWTLKFLKNQKKDD